MCTNLTVFNHSATGTGDDSLGLFHITRCEVRGVEVCRCGGVEVWRCVEVSRGPCKHFCCRWAFLSFCLFSVYVSFFCLSVYVFLSSGSVTGCHIRDSLARGILLCQVSDEFAANVKDNEVLRCPIWRPDPSVHVNSC